MSPPQKGALQSRGASPPESSRTSASGHPARTLLHPATASASALCAPQTDLSGAELPALCLHQPLPAQARVGKARRPGQAVGGFLSGEAWAGRAQQDTQAALGSPRVRAGHPAPGLSRGRAWEGGGLSRGLNTATAL